MISRWIRAVALLALAPATALAFEAVDTIVLPMRGGFDAYTLDPVYPTNLWIQAGMMYDSNPFGITDGTNVRAALGRDEKWDLITRVGVGANHTQRIAGRQSIRLGARADYNQYLNYTDVSHASYGLGVDWLWELTNDLAGTVGWGRTGGIADTSESQRATKDYITSDRLYASGAYRIGPNWRLRGGINGEWSERSGDRDDVDASLHSVLVGIDYVSTLANTIGLQWRKTRGNAPVTPLLDPGGAFTDNEYKETEYAIVASYNVGAQLRFSGTVGRAERTYTQLPIEPFDGPIYRARVDWLPGYKTVLTLEAYQAVRAVLDVDATHVEVTGFSFGPSWAPTAKLVFTARLVHERRQYQSTQDASLTPRDESINLIRLGSGWEPRRHFSVTSAIEYGQRGSNVAGRDFDHIAVMGNIRYDW